MCEKNAPTPVPGCRVRYFNVVAVYANRIMLPVEKGENVEEK